jgi:hypothetical protein
MDDIHKISHKCIPHDITAIEIFTSTKTIRLR